MLLEAQADNQRAALAAGHQALRLVDGDDGQGVGAFQFRSRLEHGIEQVAGVMTVDKVRNHLGIGIRFETVPAVGQALTQFLVVFDDTVMDDGDTIVGKMRMGIDLGGLTVGGPAGVGDTDVARLSLRCFVIQFLDLAQRAEAFQLPLLDQGQAGRIITPVLEPPETFDEDGFDVSLGQRPYDSAHDFNSCL